MDLIKWIQHNDSWLTSLGIASAIMFFASLILIPVIIIRLPADYFSAPHKQWLRNHPAFIPIFILQHIIGIILFIAGVLMLVLPGQGLLSMVLGISLISFPGRHRLLQRIFSWYRIHKTMNWVRSKAGVQPFALPHFDHKKP